MSVIESNFRKVTSVKIFRLCPRREGNLIISVGIPAVKHKIVAFGGVCTVYNIHNILCALRLTVDIDRRLIGNINRIDGYTFRNVCAGKGIARTVCIQEPVAESVVILIWRIGNSHAAVNDIGFGILLPLPGGVVLHHKGDFEIVTISVTSRENGDTCKKHCYAYKRNKQFLFYCCHSYISFYKIFICEPLPNPMTQIWRTIP